MKKIFYLRVALVVILFLSFISPASAALTISGTGIIGDSVFNNFTIPGIATGSNQCLHINSSGVVSGTGSDCGSGAGDMVLGSVQTITGAKTFGTIGGAVGKFILAGSTSGSTILNAAAVAGSTTITLPGVSGTLMLNTDDTSGKSAKTDALNTTTSPVNVSSATAPSAGYILTATDGTHATWQPGMISCQPGLGDGLNPIPTGTYLQTICANDTGATVTISSIRCFTDNAGTSTMNVSNGAGTSLLTTPIVCGSTKNPIGTAGTQSGTTTLSSGDSLSFTFTADGTSTQTTWVVSEHL